VERSTEIEEQLRELNSKMEAGDTDTVVAMHSTDNAALVIGTDEEEWVVGPTAIERLWREQPAMGHAAVEGLEAYAEGSVGWFACRLILDGPPKLNMRVTGVLRKEDGEWKFVQSHASVPRQT
jgi:ketosteroid isomerase-like protein